MESEALVSRDPAMDLVAQGATLMRVENDSMLSAAFQRPRDEAKIVKAALRELEMMPEEAGRAYYSIPYKERQPGGGVKIVKVEGPSIKAAMSLSRRWGNCSVTARILNEDATGFDLEGVFLDMETNFRVSRPGRVSKTFRRRTGQIDTMTPERQVMAVQSGASKAMRGAALAGLPPYLVSAYDKKARQIVGGDLEKVADAKSCKAVLDAFGKWGVTVEELEGYEDRPIAEWTGTEIADLRGLWNAITDEQTTVEEVFRKQSPEASMQPKSVDEAKTQTVPVAMPGSVTEAQAEDASTRGQGTGVDESLEVEARAREQAEAEQETKHPQPSVRVDRGVIFKALVAKAKAEKSTVGDVLTALAGKKAISLAVLTDAEVATLAKKLK